MSFITGVPEMVPNVTVNDNTIKINRNNIALTLSWGEPFNNLDPIVNYTVSCSGDVTCPPATTDNTTRSYTITNLTPMTRYTFSVVATNSIGSGEAGVVMITTPQGDTTNTTSSATITAATTTLNESITTTGLSLSITVMTTDGGAATSAMNMTTTPIISGVNLF